MPDQSMAMPQDEFDLILNTIAAAPDAKQMADRAAVLSNVEEIALFACK